MTSTEIGSAALLKKLARPLVEDCPNVPLQKAMIAELESAIKKNGVKFDKSVLFVGAFELTAIPAASEEGVLFSQVKLINLPSKVEAEAVPGAATHVLHATNNGFSLVEDAGMASDLVKYTLQTMSTADQLDYLRKSGIVGQQWKILVEIHYYRNRGDGVNDRLHKDTLGETIFVNLNYATDADIPGPEYVLNPLTVEEHETQIEKTLPKAFLDDLQWVRGQLGPPTEISYPTIKPNQFIAFVDEAIHHRSPHYGGRAVTGARLGKFLAEQYGSAVVKEAKDARTAVLAEEASYWSYIYSPQPFVNHLKLISAKDADMWFDLIDMVENPEDEFNRHDLVDAGLDKARIDKLLAEAPSLDGFQTVSIPGVKGDAPIAVAPLERQMSRDALSKTLPPKPVGDRRFFRTWVRARPVT